MMMVVVVTRTAVMTNVGVVEYCIEFGRRRGCDATASVRIGPYQDQDSIRSLLEVHR
jgi:hypothetical protein